MTRRPRVLVPFPPELIADIDKMVTSGKRTAFLVDLTKHELRRRRLLNIFENPEPIWKPEDHPEIDDAGNWLRQMRAETETRFQRIQSESQPER